MRSLISSLGLIVTAALAALSTDDAFAGDIASGRAKVAVCAPCHGADGVSKFPEIPHLAAQNETYLIGALVAFRRAGLGQYRPERRGSRYDAVMNHQATGMTDADIGNLAAYFSSLACPVPESAKGRGMPKLAQRCISCHGVGGRNGTSTVPRLAAQRPRYLENQLRAFRDASAGSGATGERRERFHPMMSRQAETLTDDDIRRLADYFAAQSCR